MPRPRHVEILQAVHRITRELGHEPTITEVNRALGTRPGAGVRGGLLALEGLGLIRFREDERRGAMKFPRVTRAVLDRLTVRQREVYDLALSLKRRLGHAPTIAEVNQDQGLSAFGVHSTLLELEAKGAIGFATSERRGPIEITKEGKQWL